MNTNYKKDLKKIYKSCIIICIGSSIIKDKKNYGQSKTSYII